MRRRRVDSKGEEVGWFGEVSHKAAMKDEINQDKDIHGENQGQDYDPGFRGSIDTARSVLLSSQSSVEVLGLITVGVEVSVVL